MPCRGEIWLINLNPVKKNNEMGKIRPAVVLQNSELIQNGYPTTIIVPLSSVLIENAEPIRFRVKKRDHLQEDSDAVITQIRSIDNSRFIKKIAKLTQGEIRQIKKQLNEII